MNDNNPTVGKACPICGRPPAAATRPFCSKRCADVDLSRWLGGVYRVESGEGPDRDPDAEDTDGRA